MSEGVSFSATARFWVFGSALAMIGGLASPPAFAQSPLPLAADQVSFQIRVCLGSEGEGGVDPECESIQAQLPKRFGTLKLQQQGELALELGQPQGLVLPTGSEFYFRPISILERKLQMQVNMPGVVNTRVLLASGRSVILAGVRHEEGQLFVELSPRFIAPTVPEPMLAEPIRPRRPRRNVPEVRQVGGRRVSPSAR